MKRLPAASDVLERLVDIFDPDDRYRPDPLGQPGYRLDVYTGERVYSSSFLNGSDAVEGHSRPDELEIRRRQRELDQRTRSLGAGKGNR